MEQFKRVGVTGRQGPAEITDILQRLLVFLSGREVDVVLDERIKDWLPNAGLPTCHRVVMGERCDLVIVVGGDGSLLGAARDFVAHDVSVIGVNGGRLGFLTDIYPNELETSLADVLEGRYLAESRFLLNTKVQRDGRIIGKGTSLNDVVLHPGQSTRIIEFELFIDDLFVYKQRSDGLIVATPHRLYRLCLIRRWPYHASKHGCDCFSAHVSSYANEQTAGGEW